MSLKEDSLPHYFSILQGTASPYYLLSKRIPVEIDLSSSSVHELREAHSNAMQTFLDLIGAYEQNDHDMNGGRSFSTTSSSPSTDNAAFSSATSSSSPSPPTTTTTTPTTTWKYQ